MATSRVAPDYTQPMPFGRLKLGWVLLMAALLGACGQKGALYLPDASGEVITRPSQTSPPAEPAATPATTPTTTAPGKDSSQDPPKPPPR